MCITLVKVVSTILLSLALTSATSARPKSCSFSQEKNNISLSLYQLTTKEMVRLFNCYNPVKIVRLSNQYKAFEITIANKTAHDYVLDPANIDAPIENKLIVTSKVKTNPLLLPIFTSIASIALMVSGIGLAVVPSVIAGTALGVTTLNLNMQKSNKISTKNIYSKVLDAYHPALIPCFSTIKKIIFTKTNRTKKTFPLTLETVDGTQRTTFEVEIKK